MAASLDYAAPFCETTFNLEEDADVLSFVVGSEIEKVLEKISSSNINRNRVRKSVDIAKQEAQLLVDEITDRLNGVKCNREDASIALVEYNYLKT